MDLRLPRVRGLLRGPRRVLATAAAVLVLAGAGTWTALASEEAPAVHVSDRTLPMGGGVRLDTSYFTAGSGGRRPAVLLAHGFGGSKEDVRGQAEALAREGYAVLTWSARGFGRSTGRIGLNDPEGEVADVSRLLDWLAARPEVRLDKAGDPRVGMAGGSYGGAVSLLAAGHDDRVDALAPSITYWNLSDALFPNGVFKKLWTSLFLNSGGGCARFEPALCRMYQRVAESGKPDAEARALLTARSPEAVGARVKVPTLLIQGQTDSLFPLGQADAAAKAIKANGAPVDVDWISGGHDGGNMETSRVEGRVRSWFDRYLKGDESADTGPAFRVTRTGGIDSTDGETLLRGASAERYPGLSSGRRTIPSPVTPSASSTRPGPARPPSPPCPASATPADCPSSPRSAWASPSTSPASSPPSSPRRSPATRRSPARPPRPCTCAPPARTPSCSPRCTTSAPATPGRDCPPSSSPRYGSRAPARERTSRSPCPRSTTSGARATGCGWCCPPPTSPTPPRPAPPRTPPPWRAH